MDQCWKHDKVALPVLAAVTMAVANRRNPDLEFIAVIAAGLLVGAIIVLAVVLRSENLAKRLRRTAGQAAKRLAGPFRIDVDDQLPESLADQVSHVRSTVGVVVRDRWLVASAAALSSQFLQFGILLASMRAVSVASDELHWVEIFAVVGWATIVRALGA